MTGEDDTKTPQEEAFSRLLAAIFIRVAVPVAISTADDHFTMANPVFYHLFGVEGAQLHTVRMQDITSAKFVPLAPAAREKQSKDGERYELTLEIMVPSGVKAQVRLTSMLLRDGDQRYRVITLVPVEAVVQSLFETMLAEKQKRRPAH